MINLSRHQWRSLFSGFLILGALFIPLTMQAAIIELDDPCASGESFNFKTGFDCVEILGSESDIKPIDDPVEFILGIVKFGLTFVGIIAVIVVIIGGVMYMTSLGDETKAERAKKVLLYAIIGLAIIGAAILLVNLIIGTFQGGGAGGGGAGGGPGGGLGGN